MWYHTVNGNAINTLEESGVESSDTTYYPYGKFYTYDRNAARHFTGKEKEGFPVAGSYDSGIYYFGGRYYDQSNGIFIQKDPMMQNPSPYLYCGGDPINRIDPTGLVDETNMPDFYYQWMKNGGHSFGGTTVGAPQLAGVAIGQYKELLLYNYSKKMASTALMGLNPSLNDKELRKLTLKVSAAVKQGFVNNVLKAIQNTGDSDLLRGIKNMNMLEYKEIYLKTTDGDDVYGAVNPITNNILITDMPFVEGAPAELHYRMNQFGATINMNVSDFGWREALSLTMFEELSHLAFPAYDEGLIHVIAIQYFNTYYDRRTFWGN